MVLDVGYGVEPSAFSGLGPGGLNLWRLTLTIWYVVPVLGVANGIRELPGWLIQSEDPKPLNVSDLLWLVFGFRSDLVDEYERGS